MQSFINDVENRWLRVDVNNLPDVLIGAFRDNGKTKEANEYMKQLGVTPVELAWIENNKAWINRQYESFMEANGLGVIVGVDLANGSDYTVRDGVVVEDGRAEDTERV